MAKKSKKAVVEFEWPAFKNDKERIKAMTRKYERVSIAEALYSEYKLGKAPMNLICTSEMTPVELKVGMTVWARIKSITKNGVEFESNQKAVLTSRQNLFAYDKFKNWLPTRDVNVLVTEITPKQVFVDIIQPLVNEWVLPKIKYPVSQKILHNPVATVVRDLKLVKGGYVGKAVIPTVSEFIGEEYVVDAFIPGSQIVLNITNDFEGFEGKEVNAFIVNQIVKPDPDRPGHNKMSVVCSVKEYLKCIGESNMIEIFKHWCSDDNDWREFPETELDGYVTGVINSSKRCGVFVEIPELNITGMVNMRPDKLVEFKRGSQIKVTLSGFEEDTYYNADMGQIQHKNPYVIGKGDAILECNIKPILKLA